MPGHQFQAPPGSSRGARGAHAKLSVMVGDRSLRDAQVFLDVRGRAHRKSRYVHEDSLGLHT